jgi:hypothetical protein
MSFVDVTGRRGHRTLVGILTICSYCKKILEVDGRWQTVEVYGGDRPEAEFSHGVCPECTPRLRQQLHLEE